MSQYYGSCSVCVFVSVYLCELVLVCVSLLLLLLQNNVIVYLCYKDDRNKFCNIHSIGMYSIFLLTASSTNVIGRAFLLILE